MALSSIEPAVVAYAALEDSADPLDAEMEQRLLARLVGRVLPLLLRCLRAWERGARRPQHSCQNPLAGGAPLALLPRSSTLCADQDDAVHVFSCCPAAGRPLLCGAAHRT